MIDKNLFLYDLAVVAIMKNEEPYVKEWLDYHLLAGVDHFYIYDNDSTAKFKEILQPYIDADIVTYTFYPGKARQVEAYLDALKRYKFFCRYMAFIDADEFILPKDNKNVVEVLDEIFSINPEAGSLVINWHCFGSSGEEKADYSKGVLERFTRRAENNWYMTPDETGKGWGGNVHVKTIANPRKIYYISSPHYVICLKDVVNIDEDGVWANPNPFKLPIKANKIVLNHYNSKSREEYALKVKRGNADFEDNHYSMENFSHEFANEVFDDEILKYRDAKRSALIPEGAGIEALFPSKQIDYRRISNALTENLLPTLAKRTSPNLYTGNIENFLTCLNLIPHLKEKILSENGAKIFEELALDAIRKTLHTNLKIHEITLLLGEMPKILTLPYPIIDDIIELLKELVPQIMTIFKRNNYWFGFNELEYRLDMLKSCKSYTQK